MPETSRNCRDALDADEPLEAHVCLGCEGCPCHHIEAPASLREQFEDARESLRIRNAERREEADE